MNSVRLAGFYRGFVAWFGCGLIVLGVNGFVVLKFVFRQMYNNVSGTIMLLKLCCNYIR